MRISKLSVTMQGAKQHKPAMKKL